MSNRLILVLVASLSLVGCSRSVQITHPATGGQPQAPGPAPAPTPDPVPSPQPEPSFAKKCDERRLVLKDELLASADVTIPGEKLYAFVSKMKPRDKSDLRRLHARIVDAKSSMQDVLTAKSSFRGVTEKALAKFDDDYIRDPQRNSFAAVRYGDGMNGPQHYLLGSNQAFLSSDARERPTATTVDRTRLLWLPQNQEYAYVSWMYSTINADDGLMKLNSPNLTLDTGWEYSLFERVEGLLSDACKGISEFTAEEREKFDWVAIDKFKPTPMQPEPAEEPAAAVVKE